MPVPQAPNCRDSRTARRVTVGNFLLKPKYSLLVQRLRSLGKIVLKHFSDAVPEKNTKNNKQKKKEKRSRSWLAPAGVSQQVKEEKQKCEFCILKASVLQIKRIYLFFKIQVLRS